MRRLPSFISRRDDPLIVYGCDANYFAGFQTSLASLRRFEPDVPVTLADVGIDDDQRSWCQRNGVRVVDMSFLMSLDVEIFSGQHINKAALATLFLHRLPARSFIYLDADVLVLSPLTELRAALRRADLVAVAGNAVATVDDGYRHILKRELTDDGRRSVQERFPGIDLESTAINTGVLGIRASVLKRWESHHGDLWPLFHLFRMGDQTAINILRCLVPVAESLLGAEFNFSGLAGARKGNRLKGELELRVNAHKLPELRYRNHEVRLLHNTGPVKPWQVTDDDIVAVLWRYFDANDPEVDVEALRHFESASS